eukprot:m.81901 g.81901  ORF g.81901 m.81901 type:complete len:561 (-) comp19513_c0_seq1:2181-3863(-)
MAPSIQVLRGVLTSVISAISIGSCGWTNGLFLSALLGLAIAVVSQISLKISTAKHTANADTARVARPWTGGESNRAPASPQQPPVGGFAPALAPPHLDITQVDENGADDQIEEDEVLASPDVLRSTGTRGALDVNNSVDSIVGETETVAGTGVYARGVGEVLMPPYKLTPEQKLVLEDLKRALCDLDPRAASFCDRACLCRYLRARDWKVKPAEKLLRETLEWREEYGIETVTIDDIKDELSTGKIYIHGFDRENRPVMYQKPRNENSTNYDVSVKAVAYLLERECCAMDMSAGVEKHTLIIDFKGYSIFNKPPMSVTKQVLSLLMDKYPERLGVAFLVDAPALFQACWAVVKPFLPAETKKKIFFVSRSGTAGRGGKMAEKFAEYFDDDQLEEDYGGTLPSTWGWNKFVKSERQMAGLRKNWYDAARTLKLGEKWNPAGYALADEVLLEEESSTLDESLSTIQVGSGTGKLRRLTLGGIPVGSSPRSSDSASSSARRGIGLVSPALSPMSHLQVSPMRVSRSSGRLGRVPTGSKRTSVLKRSGSTTSIRSTTSARSTLL